MSSIAERLQRIDACIALHRAAYLAAVWENHDGESAYHSGEVDRLLDLRVRIERGRLIVTRGPA